MKIIEMFFSEELNLLYERTRIKYYASIYLVAKCILFYMFFYGNWEFSISKTGIPQNLPFNNIIYPTAFMLYTVGFIISLKMIYDLHRSSAISNSILSTLGYIIVLEGTANFLRILQFNYQDWADGSLTGYFLPLFLVREDLTKILTLFLGYKVVRGSFDRYTFYAFTALMFIMAIDSELFSILITDFRHGELGLPPLFYIQYILMVSAYMLAGVTSLLHVSKAKDSASGSSDLLRWAGVSLLLYGANLVARFMEKYIINYHRFITRSAEFWGSNYYYLYRYGIPIIQVITFLAIVTTSTTIISRVHKSQSVIPS